MAKARFLTTNLCVASGVTITASSEQADYPADFLANVARWKEWRSAVGTGNQNVDFDFGSSKTLTAVALVNWKSHTGGTIKAQYWTGAAWADLGTFTLTVTATKVAVLWFASQATSKLRVLFTNTGAVDEHVAVGVVVAGAYFEPTVNLSDDLGFQRNDPSLMVSSPDGQELGQKRTKYFDLLAMFQDIVTADKDSFLAAFEANGRTDPVVFAVDPDIAAQIAYGTLPEALSARYAPGSMNRWHIALPFREAR